MAIISFDKDAPIDYVPAYGGNRESEKPSIARIRFLPYSRVEHYKRLMETKSKGVFDPVKRLENDQAVQRQQFIENIESITEYYVSGRLITDVGEIYDTADMGLVNELLVAMISASKLSEGQRKN